MGQVTQAEHHLAISIHSFGKSGHKVNKDSGLIHCNFPELEWLIPANFVVKLMFSDHVTVGHMHCTHFAPYHGHQRAEAA